MPRRTNLIPLILILLLSALLVAACGSKKKNSAATTTASTGTTSTGGGTIAAPANIKSAGKLVFCSDITYPPEESYKKGTTTPQGSDIDIGTEVAKRLGVAVRFDNTGFTGIVAALLAKKCDLIISGMNDSADRRKQVAFVDYLKVGQSFTVPKGNPKHIKTTADLAGLSASVQNGTTNKAFLDAQSKKLQAKGKKAIKVVTFPNDNDAAAALKTGKVDAYFSDAPVAANYVIQDPGSFQLGGTPVNPVPIGIAFRKSDTQLQAAVKKAIDAIYADGTIDKILTKWKMSQAVQKLK